VKKIISLFPRNYTGDRLVRDEVVPGAEWVLAGEGVATQKLDGTCCLVRGGQLYKRYEMKHCLTPSGVRLRCPPPGFEEADADPTTGNIYGWMPVLGTNPEDRWHLEAWAHQMTSEQKLIDWTYELIGPKVQGNPEGWSWHALIRHGWHQIPDCPRNFNGLRSFFKATDVEGVVWWRDPDNPDCDKVKIKGKDFGIQRGKL